MYLFNKMVYSFKLYLKKYDNVFISHDHKFQIIACLFLAPHYSLQSSRRKFV